MILPDCPLSLASDDKPCVNWAAVSTGLRELSDRDLQRLREVLVALYANAEPASQTRH
jgi:hypothetical protein